MSAGRWKLFVVVALTVALVVMSGFAVTMAQASTGTSSKPITGIENPVTVARNQGGGNEITRTWVSPANGNFHQWIENNGLKSIVIYTYDITSGRPITCSSCLITFADANAYPTGTVQLGYFGVLKDHIYKWTFSPNGRIGTSAQYFWMFEKTLAPPVASFTLTSSTFKVSVDASASYDADGYIVSYEWLWGDGSSSTGVKASHTYAAMYLRTITLTVTDNDGLTASMTRSFPPPPFMIMGYTLDSYGSPLPGCGVTVTDLRTGAFLSTVSDSINAAYTVDLNTITGGWQVGDIIHVAATKDTMSAWRDVMLTDENTNATQLQIDVIFRPVGPPPVPYTIFGYTYGSDGAPLFGCSVTVTDLRTGAYLTSVSDSVYGVYQVDLNLIVGGWAVGDTIQVTATLGTMSGLSVVLLIDSGAPYVQADVTLYPLTMLLYDSFPGSTLTGWTTYDSNPNGYVGTTSTQSVTPPYSLEVKKSETATGYAYAEHTFATTTTGTIFVQAWMMVDSNCPAPAYFYVGGSRVTLGFWNGFIQWYNDSDGWHALQAFSPGTWYLISFTINIDTGRYNIGIQQQGGPLTTYNNGYVRYGAPYTMSSVTFRAGWIDLPGAVNMYVDEVYVCQVQS